MNTPDDIGDLNDSEYLWDDDYELTEDEVKERNSRMLRRQEHFRKAAEYAATAFSRHAGVVKVVLFGSVASPLAMEVPRIRKFLKDGIATYHECRDIDMGVWVENLAALNRLRLMRVEAMNDLFRDHGIGVAHHQVDVFVFEADAGRYAGRLCIFGKCPKGKFVCRIPGCGEFSFLQRLQNFEFDATTMNTSPSIILYSRQPGQGF
jgi:predicted nucleotidyltransferase